eukprot:1157360-Pelagomonas_calceolata.AAC.11
MKHNVYAMVHHPPFFGKASIMKREPFALPPSGEVHTRLPRPTQRTPCPETWHTDQTKNEADLQCRGAGEAMENVV